MGHHSDDNVETALWRLATGARGAGLACMPPVSNIPECHGLYGLSESGESYPLSELWSPPRWGVAPQIRLTRTMKQRSSLKMVARSQAKKLSASFGSEPDVSTGGISICRPLLAFSKADLLATCQDQGVDFVSDPTNTDPTLTPRNAIRGLLEAGKMPRALQAPSIQSMIRWSEKYIDRTKDASDRLLSRCQLVDMNLSAGWLLINFPTYTNNRRGAYDLNLFLRRDLYPETAYAVPPIQKPADDPLARPLNARMQEIRSTTLRRITDLISPLPKYHHRLSSFHNPAEKLFYPASTSFNDNGPIYRQPLSLAGVQCRPFTVGEPLSKKERRRKYPDWWNRFPNMWLLNRMPYMSSQPLPTVKWGVEELTATSLISRVTPGMGNNDLRVSEWQLWDNRFWFRIAVSRKWNPDPDPAAETPNPSLTIRPVQKPDMETVRQALQSKQQYADFADFEQSARANTQVTLEDQFINDAPGTTRFTLPMLVLEDGNGGEELMALPTLGLRIKDGQHFSRGGKTWAVRVEWRYKEVDKEVIRLMSISEDEKKA